MSAYFINPVVEIAFQRFFRSKAPSWCPELNIRKGCENVDTQEMEGQESSIIRVPYVICSCESAEPVLPHFRGNWNPMLEVTVGNSADDCIAADHFTRASEIFGYLDSDSAIQELLAVYPEIWTAKLIPGSSRQNINGRVFEAVRQWTLLSCCAMSLPD